MSHTNQFYRVDSNSPQRDLETTIVDDGSFKDRSTPLGGIIINKIQCILRKRQTAKISKIVKSILKESPKLRLEFEYGQETQSTSVFEIIPRPEGIHEKYGVWEENIVFAVAPSRGDAQSVMNTDLFIRCWDPSIKGRVGCVGEAKLNLANYEKFNKEETYCELELGYNESIVVTFCVYFFSNDPPKLMMQKFNDPNIRGQRIGVIMIDKIQLTNEARPFGQVGYLEFELEREREYHSTKKYWNSTQTPWKHPIAFSFIARHEELIIKFCYGATGGSVATTKFHIGPAAATEALWPLLMNGKGVDVGEYTLMEHGLRVGKVRFEISCHCLMTSRKFYAMCVQSQVTSGQKTSSTVDSNRTRNGGGANGSISGGQQTRLSPSHQNPRNNTPLEQNITLQTVNRNQNLAPSLNQNEQQRHLYSANTTSRTGGVGSGFNTPIDQQNSHSLNSIPRTGSSDVLNAQKFGGSSSGILSGSVAHQYSSQNLRTYVNRDHNHDPYLYMTTMQTSALKSDNSHGESESLPRALEGSLMQNSTQELHSHGHEGRSRGIRYLQDDGVPRNLQTRSSSPSLKNRNNFPVLGNNVSHQNSNESLGRTIVTERNGEISDSLHRNGQRYSEPISPASSSFTLTEDNLSVFQFAHAVQGASRSQQQIPEPTQETPVPPTTPALFRINEHSTIDTIVAQPVNNVPSNNSDSGKHQDTGTQRSRADSNGSIRTASSSKYSNNPSTSISSFLPTSPEESSENSATLFTPRVVCARYVVTSPIITRKKRLLSTQFSTNSNSLSSPHYRSDSSDFPSDPIHSKSPTRSSSDRSISSQHSTSSRRVESLDSQRNQSLLAVNSSNNQQGMSKYYKGHVKKVPENPIMVKVFNNGMNFENEVLFLRKFIKSKYVVKLMDTETNTTFRGERESMDDARFRGFDEVGTGVISDDCGSKVRNSGSEVSNGNGKSSEFDGQERRYSKSSASLVITKYYGESLETNIHLFNDKQEILNVFRNICEGVKWLHDNGVVHMSLNPSSIFCKETDICSIKFSDFENTKYLDEQVYSQFASSCVLSTKTNSFASTDDSFTTPPSSTSSFIDDSRHLSCNPTSIPFQIQVTTTTETTTDTMTAPTLLNSSHPDSRSWTSFNSRSTLNSQPTTPIPHYPIGFAGPEIILPQLLLSSKSPELTSFLKNIKARKSADCFSLGAILYYLFTKKSLYGSIEELERLVREKKQNTGGANVDGDESNSECPNGESSGTRNENMTTNEKEYEVDCLIDVDETLDDDVREVVSMCLKIDEHARWSVEDILASRLMN